MSKAEKNKQIDGIIAIVIGGIVTWVISKFLLPPMCNIFGWELQWWMYVVLFLVASGTISSSIIKDRAESNIAYNDVSVKNDKFCSKCGEAIKPSACFCSNCGHQIKE